MDIYTATPKDITDCLTQYFSDLKNNTKQGLKQFSQDPVNYTAKSIGHLVNKNWDLAFAIVGGYLSTKYSSHAMTTPDFIKSMFSIGLFSVGILAPPYLSYKNLIKEDEVISRVSKNIFIGFGAPAAYEGNYISGGASLIMLLYIEIVRRLGTINQGPKPRHKKSIPKLKLIKTQPPKTLDDLATAA